MVQEEAREQTLKYDGKVERVLVESVSDHDESLLTGRMSNNTLVHFPGNQEMIGEFADVKLLECHGFYYVGELI